MGEATVPIVLVLVLAGVAVFAWRSSRGSDRSGPVSAPPVDRRAVAPIPMGTELPTFNVIALGGQETGKTVLLASMFHRLTTEIRGGGFRLETSLDQSVHLTNLYARLRDPNAEWPPGTSIGETRSFTFTCIGSAGGDEFPVLNFNYLDYAGELVGGGPVSAAAIEQREERQRDLEQRIEAAHALFGIIDGQRMRAYLHGDPAAVLYVETSIIPMISAMRKAKCPVHFVLTKWDLFDGAAAPARGAAHGGAEPYEPVDDNDRLALVREVLMAQPAIRNLVEQRRRDKRIVRLIPVSAIGRQFATMDADGHMLKRRNGRLRPINVEIPVCAVLPDLFTQIEDQLDRADEERLAAERRARARLTPLEAVSAVGKFLARPAGVALRIAADAAIGRNAFSDSIADMFIDWVGRPFDQKMGRVGAAVGDARQELAEIRLARSAVLREFSERMIVLKRQLPASDLADGDLW